MAIEYKAIERKVIGGPDKGQTRYYASVNLSGKTTIDDLTEDIEKSSTVSGADIRAVLYSLLDVIPKHLKAGNAVELGEMGQFRIAISSSGESSPEEVDSRSVKSKKILFRADKKFNRVLSDLTFKKI